MPPKGGSAGDELVKTSDTRRVRCGRREFSGPSAVWWKTNKLVDHQRNTWNFLSAETETTTTLQVCHLN